MNIQLMFLAFSISLSSGVVNANMLDQLSIPSGATVSWVGQGIEQNGLFLDIMEIKSTHPPADVINHFRQLWSGKESASIPSTIESTLGKWSVISTIRRGISVVVQISNFDAESEQITTKIKSSGFISILNTKTIQVRNNGYERSVRDIALPPGTSVMSHTKTDDHNNKADTLIATNNISVSQNYLFFKDNLARSGWKASLLSNRNGVATMGYSKSQQYCGISVTQGSDGQAVVLISRVSYE